MCIYGRRKDNKDEWSISIVSAQYLAGPASLVTLGLYYSIYTEKSVTPV